MKFKSDPGRVLTDSKTHRAIGRFDKNGIFETDDPYYIERLKLFFPVAREKSEKAKEEKPAAGKAAAKRGSPEKPEGFLGQKKGAKA